MKNKILVLLSSLAILSVGVFFIYGCGTNSTGGGGGGGSTHGTYSYFGTQSGGDAWSWIIGSGTFIGTNETIGMTVAGTWETLPSGFKKAVVRDSAGPGAPDPGSQAYFVEVPNTALLVKPTGEAGDDDKIIVCGALATAAPDNRTCSYVTMPWKDWDYTSDTAYGLATVETDGTNTNFTFETSSYTIGDVFNQATVESGFIFSDGRLTKEVDGLAILIAPSGIFVGDQGSGKGGFIGMIKPTSDLWNDASTHQFRGVLFKYNTDTGSGETKPIAADPLTGHKLHGFDINVETGDNDTTHVSTIEWQSFDAASGIVTTQMDEGNGTPSTLKMLICKSNGKYVVFGIQLDYDNMPNNFIAVQAD